MEKARGFLFVCLGLMFFFVVGCGTPAPTITEEELHIKKVALLYGRYVSKHKGVGPGNHNELKAFAKTLSPDQLQSLGIEPGNLDQVFTSPRDQKNYVIRSMDQKQAMSDPESKGKGSVVAYERDGDGKGNRNVAFFLGGVEQLSSEQFKKLVPEAK